MADAFADAHPEATGVQAQCVVDTLFDTYGADGLELELERAVADDDFEETQYRAMFACGMREDVRDQLAGQLERRGLTTGEAECVADALTGDLDDDDLDVLLSGELTDAFFDKYFGAMSACDALPS